MKCNPGNNIVTFTVASPEYATLLPGYACSWPRSRQLVIYPLRTLKFAIGAGIPAFPRHVAGDAGIFSGATKDVVHTLEIAVGRSGAGKLREDTVAVGIAKGAKTFVLAVVIDNENSEETIRRAKMQWAGTLVIKSHTSVSAMALNMLVRHRQILTDNHISTMNADAAGLGQRIRNGGSAECGEKKTGDENSKFLTHISS